MKTNSRILIQIIAATVLCLGLSSCAHRSGHVVRNYPTYARNEPPTRTEQSQRQPENIGDTDVRVPNHQGSATKLEGKDIFQKYNSAVFMVYTSDGHYLYQGSGFFINSSGLAVSNYHVFKGTGIGQEEIKLAGSDRYYKVSEIVKRSDDEDFIIFKVNISNTNYIPIAKAKPSVGERVFALGSPLGLENTFSSGEVSQWREKNVMQISALIDHGSSGGALINEYGEVVGITSGTFASGSQANLNYAMSIDVIKPYINQSSH